MSMERKGVENEGGFVVNLRKKGWVTVDSWNAVVGVDVICYVVNFLGAMSTNGCLSEFQIPCISPLGETARNRST